LEKTEASKIVREVKNPMLQESLHQRYSSKKYQGKKGNALEETIEGT